ncbi:MAG: hypothetical protein AB7P03_20780 [Kofleriaceae bacterium]
MHVIWQPPTNDRIRSHTSDTANDRIDRETQSALNEVLDSPERIRARLAELDQEWGVDRTLMVVFSALGGISAAMAMRTYRRKQRFGGWAALFFTQIGFFAYHAARGWCPPLPVLRRFKLRSTAEIAAERVMLEKRLLEFEPPIEWPIESIE